MAHGRRHHISVAPMTKLAFTVKVDGGGMGPLRHCVDSSRKAFFERLL